MKPLKIVLPILLIGAGVVGISVYLYSKPSAVPASPAPRVAVKDEGKTINLAASGKGEGGTKATSTLQAFRDRIMKAKAEKNRAKRMALLSEAVQALDPSLIREALAEIEMNWDRQQGQLQGMLLSLWGESDPRAALTYALRLDRDVLLWIPFEKIQSVMSSWAEKDFPAAKAWLEGLPADSKFRNCLWPFLAFGVAQRDPASALGLASAQRQNLSREDLSRNEILSAAIAGWSLKDADAAIAYVAQLPDDEDKIDILESMIRTLAPKNPDKAINLVEQIPTEKQNFALWAFGNAWAQSDPKAALDWANQQTDPEVKSEILKGVIQAMSLKDPNSAFQLAQSLPAGDSRDDSIRNSLNDIAQSDPRSAIGLASGIADADLRSKAQQIVVTIWKSVDPAAATRWVNSSTLPQDVKTRLLQQD